MTGRERNLVGEQETSKVGVLPFYIRKNLHLFTRRQVYAVCALEHDRHP
jgi:hypothetical protein